MKLASGSWIKYNGFTGKIMHLPDGDYDARTNTYRPPYEAYWFVPEPQWKHPGFWVRIDDPVIKALKLPIECPWDDTDIWVDSDGDWWICTPLDQVFFLEGPQTEQNLSLWLTCLHHWDRLHSSSSALTSFNGLRPLVLVIEELP